MVNARSLIVQVNINCPIRVTQGESAFAKIGSAQTDYRILAEAIALNRNADNIRVQLAVIILIMKELHGVSAGWQVGECGPGYARHGGRGGGIFALIL